MKRLIRAWLRTNPAPDELVSPGRKGWLTLAVVALISILFLACVQFSKFDLLGDDSFYHVRVAELMRTHGLLDEVPWAQASVYRDQYVDTAFLFHLLLIPVLGEDLRLGPKLLTVLLAACLLVLLTWLALRHGFPWPWLWAVLVLGGGVALQLRLNLTQPHLVAVLLTLLVTHFVLRRHVLGVFLVSLVFPLAFVATHLVMILVGMYAVACLLRSEGFPWKLFLAVVCGTALGLVLHPNRADFLSIWYTVIFGDLSNVVLGSASAVREVQAPSLSQVVWNLGLVLPGMFVVVLAFLLSKRSASLRTLFLFLLMAAFFAIYLGHKQFIIYVVPLWFLFIGSGMRDLLAGFDLRGWSQRHRRQALLLLGTCVLLLFAQLSWTLLGAQSAVASEPTPRYRAIGSNMNSVFFPMRIVRSFATISALTTQRISLREQKDVSRFRIQGSRSECSRSVDLPVGRERPSFGRRLEVRHGRHRAGHPALATDRERSFPAAQGGHGQPHPYRLGHFGSVAAVFQAGGFRGPRGKRQEVHRAAGGPYEPGSPVRYGEGL